MTWTLLYTLLNYERLSSKPNIPLLYTHLYVPIMLAFGSFLFPFLWLAMIKKASAPPPPRTTASAYGKILREPSTEAQVEPPLTECEWAFRIQA